MKNLITLIFVILMTNLFAQTNYSADRTKFVKEFQSAINVFGKGDYTKFVKDELQVILLETKDFPENYFQTMVETCNQLVAKRFDAYPEIYNYVFSIYSLVKNKQTESSFNAFQSTINKLLESRNPKRFTDFAESSAGFLSDGKLAAKPTFEWYYEGGTYEFRYDDKPFMELKGGNLICRAVDVAGGTKKNSKFSDSLIVYKTSGTYDPTNQRWIGNGGTVTWEKVGLSTSETFATVGKYQASMKTTNLTADSVKIKTPYFKDLIEGTLSDRAQKINREEDKIYPQFISYKSNHSINNVKPNVNYTGAFAMRGAKFVGTGVKTPATITVLRNSKPFVTLKSFEISISDKSIYSNNGYTAIYLQTGDSIVHPNINFNYYYQDGFYEFSRSTTGLGQAPFTDSYHKLDYYVPLLILRDKENIIEFTFDKGTSQEQRLARFESWDYFDIKLYNQLQGLSTTNPLLAISKYAYKYDKYDLSEGEVATALGGTIEQVKPLMLQLANYGFINYDTEKKRVVVNQKLENFVQGQSGKKDYDNIIFVSDFRPKELKGYSEEEIKNSPELQKIKENYKKENEVRRALEKFGSFSLTTLNIELLGVDRVTLSDKQNTFIYPKDYRVTVKKNRDIEFSGWLNTGKIEINTIVANYIYESNKVNLLKTGETILRVQPRDKAHGSSGIPMISTISDIVGEVAIDLPDNRSGKRSDATTGVYPVLTVKNATKVLYNYPTLFKGAYDSTRFYYALQPFVIDSTDNFNDRTLRLKGELVSAGIFPTIKEDLKIMPDYSFGFSTQAPTEGLNFYGTGAKYNNKIMLSGSGLQGAGTIDFVKSKSVSKQLFTFLPDSTVGVVQFTNAMVANGIQFPDATCDEAYMTYLPKKQVLKATSTVKTDITLFNKQANLRGTAYITPKGMTASGIMSFNNATIVSQKFVYESQDLYADTSSFNLKNKNREEGEDPLIFETNNVNSHVSFTERKGIFNSNKGESRVDFPVNQYMCKMDLFTWFMDKDMVDMEKKANKDLTVTSAVDLLGPNFYSIHPKQDSLQFRAPKAKLDMAAKTITCSEVEYINVADARIYPDSSKVIIRKKAAMDQLDNATIIANYITKYHKFERASVNITARRAYKGKGEYPYYDKDSIPMYIVMDNIYLDSSYQTVGRGKIEKEKAFKLSPQFDYYGDLIVKASTPEILFSGATRINHNCSTFEQNWLAFTSNVNPKNIQIPVKGSMKNLEGQSISAGIVWRDSPNIDSIILYPTFLSSLMGASDPVVITSEGFLTYDEKSKEFQIASKEKLINRNAKGNFLSLNTETCSMYGDGIINLGMDHGEVKISSVGTVEYNQKNGKIDFNLTAKINMPMEKNGVLKELPEKINNTEGLNPMDFYTNTTKLAVATWGSQAEADKLEEDFTIKGELKKIPQSLESTMTITGLRLSYYNEPTLNSYKGLITNVESAVLVSMFDKPIMKYISFRAFFQQKYSGAGGDWFGLLLNIPGQNEYFFNYTMGKKEGTLDISTTDIELTTAISSMKEDKRKSKNFIYQIGQGGIRTVFNNLFIK